MIRVNVDGGKPVKIWASVLEPAAEQQAVNIAKLPFVHKHVALMPDAHLGKGSCIGAVFATKGAIVPSAIGVDIGCGMSAVKLPVKLEDIENLPALLSKIEAAVPTGFHSHPETTKEAAHWWAMWGDIGKPEWLGDKQRQRAASQLGTLGGGNHFIELCGDETGHAWVVLHSGSRNIGKTIAEWHIGLAKGLMKQYFIEPPDPDLAYLVQDTLQFDEYIRDMKWAQDYASANRTQMLKSILSILCEHVGRLWGQRHSDYINCHHNYCQLENHFGANVWVTRKGAVRARNGELGIIPGSMGTRSYIVQGLGNPESFHSCAHGAGRAMSRKEARRRFTVDDLIGQTFGVECRKDDEIIDELPAAYKDINVVMADQADLVTVVHALKQVLCVKGA